MRSNLIFYYKLQPPTEFRKSLPKLRKMTHASPVRPQYFKTGFMLIASLSVSQQHNSFTH